MRVDFPALADTQDLFRILADPARFTALVAELEAVVAQINARLGLVDTLEKAETMFAQASAKLTEASQIRSTADAELRDARQHAEALVRDSTAHALEQRRTLTERAEALDERDRIMTARLAACAQTERAVAERERRAGLALEDVRLQIQELGAERTRLRGIAERLTAAAEGL